MTKRFFCIDGHTCGNPVRLVAVSYTHLLALSNRGLKALDRVGLKEKIQESCIPMPGRMIHDLEGNLDFQPYGKEGQYINSVSRGGLNWLLMDQAEAHGVEIRFDHRCIDVDFESATATFDNGQSVSSDFLFGGDGAVSYTHLAVASGFINR